MPVQNVNINNVSMDYFLRGVEAAKPKNAPQGPQEAQAGANAVAAPELEAAGKMVSQLDVLLMKAAKVSTQSLDGKQVKNKLQNLVADGVLSRDSLNLLAKTADTAAKTLKALDKFSGSQLAEAFDKKGKFDASTKVGKAIAAAVKAQQDLSDLKRELNRLHWLDLLTGQTDRHWDNYFVHIDVKTHKVTVKGIDNDACFSQYRTGATRFSFDKNRADLFKAKLLNVANKIDSGHANDEYAHLLADPGITADENGGLTIDASKVRNKAVIYALKGVTGAKTLAVPDKIDSETYNALMELKAGPKRDAYLDSIRPRLSQDSYNAAVSRLDDVIAHAEKLKDEGRIVQGNGWQHVRETPLQTGKVTVQKRNGQNKQIGGDIASVVNELTCPSYFARDKLSKIFA